MSDNTTLIDNLNSIKNSKADIKQALIDKGQQATDVLDTYAGLIEDIETGIDTSDATATASDIKEGKTAYVDGEKITGIYVDEDLTDVLDAQDQKIAELEQSLENKTAGGDNKPNIFVQLEEPTKKGGIWLQKEAEPEHYVYDGDVFVSGAWKPSGTYATIPYDFYNGSAVTIGTNIYLFGGSGGLTKAYKYDTLTNSYTRLSNIPYISGGGSATIIGTDIYMFGSSDSSCRYNAYKYNTLSDSYTQLANIPYAFTYGSVVALGSNIYLFGSNITTAGNKYAYKYNISTNTYTRLSDIPRNFYSGSAVLVKTAAFVLGGSPDKRGVSAFGLENTSYEADNLVVISQEKLGLGYQTELYNNPDDIMPAKYSFTDAWYYTLEGGLETDIPTYYGDGTQWIKFKN